MAPKQDRIIGPAKDEMDPNLRAERDRDWEARNLDSRNPTSLGSSIWNTNPATPAASGAKSDWRPGQTRREIFAKMQGLEGRARVTQREELLREAQARQKVYEDMHKRGCESGDVAASAVNVDYYIDACLWTDHVQERTKEEFPWEWPALFQEDKGYANYLASIASRDQWKAHVQADDETIRAQRQQENAETEARLKAEGKDWAALSATIQDTHTPIVDKDGERVVGKPQLVIRTTPSAAEPAKAEAAKPAKKEAAAKAEGKAEGTLWSLEQMTELYKELFGAGAQLVGGMGGFQLPMEESLAKIVTKTSIGEASMLFPACVEIRPVTLGWGRIKLCLQFKSWVGRDQVDFPVYKSYLVWSWWTLVKWKHMLLKVSDAKDDTMYKSISVVVDGWTQRTVWEVDLSPILEAWEEDIEADEAGLDPSGFYGAVIEVITSSRGQDDESRACAMVDWAGADAERFGGGPRHRTYLAVTAMYQYCSDTAGEEKLGMIAKHMSGVHKHAAPALLKKRAAEAAKGI